jgi:hypothetical protein
MEFFTRFIIHERRFFVCTLNNAVSSAQDHYHSLGFAKLLGPGAGVESVSVMEKLAAGNKKQKVDVTSVVCIILSGESVCKLHLLNFALADSFSSLGQLMVFMLRTLTRGLSSEIWAWMLKGTGRKGFCNPKKLMPELKFFKKEAYSHASFSFLVLEAHKKAEERALFYFFIVLNKLF